MSIMKNRDHYNKLANLFRYPDELYKQNVAECAKMLKDNYHDAYAEIRPFVQFVETKDLYEIEEVFGKTFHIQAICFLDLGYVLFAEDYKRGEFLVKMKDEQRRANNDCGDELADNLPNVLTLMALMEDEEFLGEFAVRIMDPALDKMLAEFDQARMELKDKVRKKKQKVILLEDMENKNIYQFAIQALLYVVKEDFKSLKFNDPEIVPTLGGNFLKSCNTGCSTTPQPVKTN
jgi:nitrate reductase assembly molybdenum cofactor insertion protein NarJ